MKKQMAMDDAEKVKKYTKSRTTEELGNSVRDVTREMRREEMPKMTRYVQYQEENRARFDMPIIAMPSRIWGAHTRAHTGTHRHTKVHMRTPIVHTSYTQAHMCTHIVHTGTRTRTYVRAKDLRT